MAQKRTMKEYLATLQSNQQVRVISYDPGEDTGWVRHEILSPGQEPRPFVRGCFMDDNHHLEIEDQLDVYRPHIIICEDFTYRVTYVDKKNQQGAVPGISLMSRNYIGVIEAWVMRFNRTSNKGQKKCVLHMRPPGYAFDVYHDDVLKKLGIFQAGARKTNGAPHTNDATRHLIGALVDDFGRKDYLLPLKPTR